MNRFEEWVSKGHDLNKNIQPELYLLKTWSDLPPDLETVWKQRVLLENTPKGNVCMFYDLYKQAFAYHSDSQISYDVLNACAMKYTRIYACYDFFADTLLRDKNPFCEMKEEEERLEKEGILDKKANIGLHFDPTVFVTKPKKRIAFVDFRNNFRYLGRFSSLNILQPGVKANKTSYRSYKARLAVQFK